MQYWTPKIECHSIKTKYNNIWAHCSFLYGYDDYIFLLSPQYWLTFCNKKFVHPCVSKKLFILNICNKTKTSKLVAATIDYRKNIEIWKKVKENLMLFRLINQYFFKCKIALLNIIPLSSINITQVLPITRMFIVIFIVCVNLFFEDRYGYKTKYEFFSITVSNKFTWIRVLDNIQN